MSHSAWLIAVPSGWGITGVDQYLKEMLERYDENRAVDPYWVVEAESVATWFDTGYYLDTARKWLDTINLDDDEYFVAFLEEKRDSKNANDKWELERLYRGNPFEQQREQAAMRQKALELRKYYGEVYKAVRCEGQPDALTDGTPMPIELPTKETIDGPTMVAIVNMIEKGQTRYTFDHADGKIYRETTYNPDSLWDYYQIGGRWSGALLARSDAPSTQLVGATIHWTEREFGGSPLVVQQARPDELETNGGLVGALDIASMRANASVKAHEAYDKWEAALELVRPELIAEAHNWAWFLAERDADRMTIDEARTAYHAQPLYIATKDLNSDHVWGPSPIDDFLGVTRDDYVTLMANKAAVFYGFIDLDGEINRKGKMGWFGMDDSTDESEAAYLKAANAWIDSLTPDTILVVVDFHI